eukprot:1513000-Rhodomonas_salina.3
MVGLVCRQVEGLLQQGLKFSFRCHQVYPPKSDTRCHPAGARSQKLAFEFADYRLQVSSIEMGIWRWQFAGGFDDEANGLFARVHDALSDVIALNHQLDE